MTSPEHCQLLASYNRWMNQRLYACCAQLDDAARKRDSGAFFKSIHGTLNHNLLGDKIWLGRFVDQPFSVTSLAQELYADFDELRAEREATDTRIDAWSTALTPAWLAADFTYRRSNGASSTSTGWMLATHFFNHQTHHRGQLTTLIKQAGIDPGDTDLLLVPGVIRTAARNEA